MEHFKHHMAEKRENMDYCPEQKCSYDLLYFCSYMSLYLFSLLLFCLCYYMFFSVYFKSKILKFEKRKLLGSSNAEYT